MTLNKEELKSKIIYRSSYRGTKEMDILLSTFVKKIINNLNFDELEMLHNLIKLDDDNLLKFNRNLKTSIEIPKNKITKEFQNFNL